MYHWMITCMGISNISLTEEIRGALEDTAVAMIHSGKDTASFKAGSAEGRVRKERDYISFMNDGGPFFSAEVETDLGTGKVRFIIPGRYIQSLANGIEFYGRAHLDDRHLRQAAKAAWN